MLLTVAVCALVVIVGAGVWAAGSTVRWLERQVDRALTDSSVLAAEDRLIEAGWEFARSLERVAERSYPTVSDIAAAAADSGLAVATLGVAPTVLRAVVVGVKRQVPSEGTVEDVWTCFDVRVPVPGGVGSGAEVESCRGIGSWDPLEHAARWLDQGYLAAELGRRLVAESPADGAGPSVGSVIDGLRVVAAERDGATVTVYAVDEAGTVVLGTPDAYLYGVRVVAGPGGSTVAAVSLPVELDPAIRAQAETEAIGLAEAVWPGASWLLLDAGGVRGLDLDRGKLVTVVGYEATADGLTLHLAVEVVAGGRRVDNPSPSPIVVCVDVVTEGWGNNTLTKSITVAQCPYPLIPSA